MSTPFLPHDRTALVSAATTLRTFVTLDAIYCFSYRSFTHRSATVLFPDANTDVDQHRYGLLLFAQAFPPQFVADASETIRQQSQGLVSVTLLTYATAAVSQEGEHQWLLHEIIRKGFRVYRRRSQRHLLRFAITPTRNYEHTEKQWRYRKYMATCYREAESGIQNPNGDAVQVSLLHAALEQLCLGLIFVFLGCKPECFGINYLLRVCDVVTGLSGEVFPDRTIEDKRLLKVLGTNHQIIRHQPNLKISITDVEVLRKRVVQFEVGVLGLVEEELGRLSV